VGKSLAARMEERHAELLLRRDAQRLGVTYESLRRSREEDARVQRAIDSNLTRWQTQVFPLLIQGISERIILRLPEFLNRFGERIVALATEQISRRILEQLPAGLLALPPAAAVRQIEEAVKRIPIQDMESILEQLAAENAKLAD